MSTSYPGDTPKNKEGKGPSQVDLKFYALDDVDKKILLLIDDGFYLSQISRKIGKSLSVVCRRAHKMEENDILDRIGNAKPVEYKVLIDNIPALEKTAPGVQPTAQNPLLEIHGALIKFSNLHHLHSQLEKKRSKLPQLKFFDRIDDSPHNRTDYLFRFGNYQIQITTKSALIKKLPNNRYRAPVDLSSAVEIEGGIVFPYEEKEEKAMERAKNAFAAFLKRIRSESNGMLRIGPLSDIECKGWTQKREYAFNYGEDKVKLAKTPNGVKLVIDDLPDGWLDQSPLPGEKAEAEGLKTLAQDLGLVRALRSEGIVTKKSLDMRFEELGEELSIDNAGPEIDEVNEKVEELRKTQEQLVTTLTSLSKSMNEIVKSQGYGKARDPDSDPNTGPGSMFG